MRTLTDEAVRLDLADIEEVQRALKRIATAIKWADRAAQSLAARAQGGELRELLLESQASLGGP